MAPLSINSTRLKGTLTNCVFPRDPQMRESVKRLEIKAVSDFMEIFCFIEQDFVGALHPAIAVVIHNYFNFPLQMVGLMINVLICLQNFHHY